MWSAQCFCVYESIERTGCFRRRTSRGGNPSGKVIQQGFVTQVPFNGFVKII